MNGRTSFLSLLYFGIVTVAQAGLHWDKTELDLHPAEGDATAVGVFKYTNKGDKPIHFKAVRPSCGCTTAAMPKNDVAPGEKGEITATFTIGDRTGLQVKTVTVETDDAQQPQTVLTLKATITQALELQPAMVFWQTGEDPKPKTITAKSGKDMPLKNIEVTPSSPDFTAKVEPGTGIGEFRIVVQPRDTKNPVNATLTIKPNGSAGSTKIYSATARVIPATQ
ncbi:MAG: hypothetical protein QOH88_2694 [Verrucomicrobiota bacterium]